MRGHAAFVISAARLGLLAAALTVADPWAASARPPDPAAPARVSPTTPEPAKGIITVADNRRSTDRSAEMKAAKALTTRCWRSAAGPPRPRRKKGPRSCPPRLATRCGSNWPARSINGSRRATVPARVPDERDRSCRGARASRKAAPRSSGHDDVRTHSRRAAVAARPAAERTNKIAATAELISILASRLPPQVRARDRRSRRRGR
jgi:hypothetical protein